MGGATQGAFKRRELEARAIVCAINVTQALITKTECAKSVFNTVICDVKKA